jgi:hypothetical protein
MYLCCITVAWDLLLFSTIEYRRSDCGQLGSIVLARLLLWILVINFVVSATIPHRNQAA